MSESKKNLKPVRTKSEARARGKKGGIASGKARAEKKLIKDTLEMLLESGEDQYGMTVQEKICLSVVKRAVAGDIKAAEFIRDSIGQKPVNETKTELTGGIDITALMERGKRIASDNTDKS